jgi:hypothetical protein
MNRKNLSLTIIFLISFCFSCIDIFEKDLSGSKVQLTSPEDSLSTAVISQSFRWKYLTGSLWYELQIANPDFSEVSNIKLDTILEFNYFQYTLQPGIYHWRVRSGNGSNASDYSENLLTIIDGNK